MLVLGELALVCKLQLYGNHYYLGGAPSKGFATFRNVLNLLFLDKIGHAKSVSFRFESAIWRSDIGISS